MRPLTTLARTARRARAGHVLAALALLAATAPTAQAQITNRLKKLAKDAAKNAVSGGKDSATTSAAGAAGGNTSAKVDLTITVDRVTMVLAALKPAVEKAQMIATAKAEKEAYDAKLNAAQSCVQNATGANAMPTQAGMAAAEKILARQEALSKRYNAALLGDDMRKRVYLEDSLQVVTHLYTATMFGTLSKCGARPYAPTSLLELTVLERRGGGNDDGARELTIDEPARSAMTRYQFGMVRERIALYAMGEAGLVAASKLGKEGVFTDAELAVLQSHRDELVKMAPLFKSSALTWSGSSDLRGW